MFWGESRISPEDDPLFEVKRPISLGDVQLGTAPTPFDRFLAARLANAAIQFIVQKRQEQSSREDDGFFVGMVEGGIKITSMSEFKNLMLSNYSRPKKQWWFDYLIPRSKLLA